MPKIAGIAHERGKGVIIAVNKWDAVEKDDKTIYKHDRTVSGRYLHICLMQSLSSFLQRQGSEIRQDCLRLIDMVIENQSMRIADWCV